MNLRDLANRVAAHPRIEQAVSRAIRSELPTVIESILCEMYPGEQVRFYAPKKSVNLRRERDTAIRAEHNGHNTKALGTKFGISPRMVLNVVRKRGGNFPP